MKQFRHILSAKCVVGMLAYSVLGVAGVTGVAQAAKSAKDQFCALAKCLGIEADPAAVGAKAQTPAPWPGVGA
jgi:hypothetical protein